MIDIENEVFTAVEERLREKFPDIYVTGERLNAPPDFPCASIIETDNFLSPENIDSSDEERFVSLLYEVNAYSNKGARKKSECKSIMAVINEVMYSLNFRRTVNTPIEGEDTSIYRMTARYVAKTDGKHIYRR